MYVTAEETFDNFTPISVCIMSHDYLVVASEETYDENGNLFRKKRDALVRLSFYNMGNEVLRWFPSTYKQHSWLAPKLVNTNLDEFIITDQNRWIYYMGVGKNKQYEDDLPINDALCDIKNINGRIFGVTAERMLVARKGVSDWDLINDAYEEGNSNQGFEAIDGFSEEEIYMAGADRDVWMFNYPKREWKQIDVGVSERMMCKSVCCAEDGNVYIGGENGILAWGRGDNWHYKRLAIADKAIKSIVSFKGKVYLGTQDITYILDDNMEAQAFDFDGKLSFAGGDMMYAAHGMMIVANQRRQVALFDGKEWQDLHGCESLNPVLYHGDMR